MSLRIREVREQKGMTLEELAAKANTSISHLSDVERGKKDPGSKWLCRVARALDVTMDDLVICDDE